MTAFRILARGDWRAGAVRAHWVPSTLRMPPEVVAAVDAAWADAAARPGIHLFDGPLCRVEGWDSAGPTLRLDLSRT
ncbi:MAG: hypothetical protein H0V44_01030, partial [Planctomycetes bacterium]|nr:hypothetical protein [Planctomycetota bacterium]